MTIVSGNKSGQSSVDGNMTFWKSVPYMEFTAKDSTDTFGPNINNEDGLIDSIAAIASVTDSAAANSSLQLGLYGSMDGTNFSAVVDSSGNAITSGSATDVTGATGGATTVNVAFDTLSKGRRRFPWKFLAVKVLLTGASKGATFKLYVTAEKAKSGRIFV